MKKATKSKIEIAKDIEMFVKANPGTTLDETLKKFPEVQTATVKYNYSRSTVKTDDDDQEKSNNNTTGDVYRYLYNNPSASNAELYKFFPELSEDTKGRSKMRNTISRYNRQIQPILKIVEENPDKSAEEIFLIDGVKTVAKGKYYVEKAVQFTRKDEIEIKPISEITTGEKVETKETTPVAKKDNEKKTKKDNSQQEQKEDHDLNDRVKFLEEKVEHLSNIIEALIPNGNLKEIIELKKLTLISNMLQ